MKKSIIIVIIILGLVIGIPVLLKIMYDQRVNSAQESSYQRSTSSDS